MPKHGFETIAKLTYHNFITTGLGEHFDITVWDPTDPERAIEDPVHGPIAVLRRLSISAMPPGDGLYLQPGSYDAYGTSYVDPKGRPIPIAEIGKLQVQWGR